MGGSPPSEGDYFVLSLRSVKHIRQDPSKNNTDAEYHKVRHTSGSDYLAYLAKRSRANKTK